MAMLAAAGPLCVWSCLFGLTPGMPPSAPSTSSPRASTSLRTDPFLLPISHQHWPDVGNPLATDLTCACEPQTNSHNCSAPQHSFSTFYLNSACFSLQALFFPQQPSLLLCSFFLSACSTSPLPSFLARAPRNRFSPIGCTP